MPDERRARRRGALVHIKELTDRLEHDDRLDGLVDAVDRRVPAALRAGPAHEQLLGRGLGHAVHPVLTDLPIGTWVSATILDLLDAPRWQRPSQVLTGIGLVAAVPTIASGLAEWTQADRTARRVTAVHAAVNTVAVGCYLVSFVAKARSRPRGGRAASIAGSLAAGVGGYLGGHLSYVRGVGVDRHGRRDEGRAAQATG